METVEDDPPEASVPHARRALVAMSVLSMGVFLWCGGFFVGVGIRQQNWMGLVAMLLCGLAGPGGLAVLQFLGTFQARRIGAITCTLFYLVASVVAAIIGYFFMTAVMESRLSWQQSSYRVAVVLTVSIWSWASFGLNLERTRQLLTDPAIRPVPLRFTIREFFLFMLAVGIVLGGASFAAHR